MTNNTNKEKSEIPVIDYWKLLGIIIGLALSAYLLKTL